MAQIRDSVVMGDVNIGHNQFRCPNCNAEGSITIFTCRFTDCSSKFCQHCSPTIDNTVCLNHISRYDAINKEREQIVELARQTEIQARQMMIQKNIAKYQNEHEENEIQFQKELLEIRKKSGTYRGNPEDGFWVGFISLVGFWIVVISTIIYLLFFF